uniref:Uncharacterized protein n=1 Tax=Anguilla anguilla TaxID=7936 RepID=A0A0E9QJP9_ANGAN
MIRNSQIQLPYLHGQLGLTPSIFSSASILATLVFVCETKHYQIKEKTQICIYNLV